MNTYYFTFGSGHFDAAGNPLHKCFTPIVADDEGTARSKMHEARGGVWSTSYQTAEAAGVERWGLEERSLESVALNNLVSRREYAQRRLQSLRDELNAGLALAARCENIMERMPEDAIDGVHIHFSTGEMMIYGLDHDRAIACMSAIGAGKWKKKLCPGNSLTIDYNTTVDGVDVEIYGTPPPASCKIVEEEIEVPARKEIKLTLVCH